VKLICFYEAVYKQAACLSCDGNRVIMLADVSASQQVTVYIELCTSGNQDFMMRMISARVSCLDMCGVSKDMLGC
jgi:hypothetical protein